MKTAKSALLLLPLLDLALLAGCNEPPKPKAASQSTAPASYLEKIKARDKLVVGVFTDKPPFGFVDETGRYVGFDTGMAAVLPRICWAMKTRSSSSRLNLRARIPFLQSDKVDLILANMTVTPERKEAVEFTNSNLKVAVQALVPQASEVKNLDDLATRTTLVTTGTTADIWLIKNEEGQCRAA